jgi:hypothetical protein
VLPNCAVTFAESNVLCSFLQTEAPLVVRIAEPQARFSISKSVQAGAAGLTYFELSLGAESEHRSGRPFPRPYVDSIGEPPELRILMNQNALARISPFSSLKTVHHGTPFSTRNHSPER